MAIEVNGVRMNQHTHAWKCLEEDCQHTFIAANPQACPKCGSTCFWPLEKWINRKEKYNAGG